MGMDDELREIAIAVRAQGLSGALSLIHFRSLSSDGISGRPRIIFRRLDDGREVNLPLPNAVELLRLRAKWTLNALWQEFERRCCTVGREMKIELRQVLSTGARFAAVPAPRLRVAESTAALHNGPSWTAGVRSRRAA